MRTNSAFIRNYCVLGLKALGRQPGEKVIRFQEVGPGEELPDSMVYLLSIYLWLFLFLRQVEMAFINTSSCNNIFKKKNKV